MCIVPKLSKFSIDSNIQIWLHGLPDYLPIFVNVSKNTDLLDIVVIIKYYIVNSYIVNINPAYLI